MCFLRKTFTYYIREAVYLFSHPNIGRTSLLSYSSLASPLLHKSGVSLLFGSKLFLRLKLWSSTSLAPQPRWPQGPQLPAPLPHAAPVDQRGDRRRWPQQYWPRPRRWRAPVRRGGRVHAGRRPRRAWEPGPSQDLHGFTLPKYDKMGIQPQRRVHMSQRSKQFLNQFSTFLLGKPAGLVGEPVGRGCSGLSNDQKDAVCFQRW